MQSRPSKTRGRKAPIVFALRHYEVFTQGFQLNCKIGEANPQPKSSHCLFRVALWIVYKRIPAQLSSICSEARPWIQTRDPHRIPPQTPTGIPCQDTFLIPTKDLGCAQDIFEYLIIIPPQASPRRPQKDPAGTPPEDLPKIPLHHRTSNLGTRRILHNMAVSCLFRPPTPRPSGRTQPPTQGHTRNPPRGPPGSHPGDPPREDPLKGLSGGWLGGGGFRPPPINHRWERSYMESP